MGSGNSCPMLQEILLLLLFTKHRDLFCLINCFLNPPIKGLYIRTPWSFSSCTSVKIVPFHLFSHSSFFNNHDALCLVTAISTLRGSEITWRQPEGRISNNTCYSSKITSKYRININCKHGVSFHIYPDNMQLHLYASPLNRSLFFFSIYLYISSGGVAFS